MDVYRVLCEVRNESLYIRKINCSLQRLTA